MANPPKTIGKLGNVGIAGVGWETSQVYAASSDLSSGIQLFPAPSLYSRANHLTSLDISTSSAGMTVHLSGSAANIDPSYSVIFGQSALSNTSPLHCSFIDPIDFPTGQAVKIISDNTGVIYVTAKYFVE